MLCLLRALCGTAELQLQQQLYNDIGVWELGKVVPWFDAAPPPFTEFRSLENSKNNTRCLAEPVRAAVLKLRFGGRAISRTLHVFPTTIH